MRSLLAAIVFGLIIVPASASGISSPLMWKAQEIVRNCNSVIISGVRRGARVAGTRRVSLHASGRAVDLRGNPACIYSYLHGWRGGYSTDYASVKHVHISLGGREDGIRFTHHARGHRYAKRHHRHGHRYARA